MVFNLDMYKKVPHRGIDIPPVPKLENKALEDFQNLEFLRDDKGRWTQVVAKEGWYQDRNGNLYQYDGVIWDEVPSARIEDLEYLG